MATPTSGALRTLQSLLLYSSLYTKISLQITSQTKWRSRVRNVLQAASNSFERTLQSAARILLSTCALALAKQSDEETSDRLDGQDASRPPSVDGEAVPGGEQAPTQGRPRRSDPDLSAVREEELSDHLHQQDDRGTGVPSVQGPRGAGPPWWTECMKLLYTHARMRVCVCLCVCVCRT